MKSKKPREDLTGKRAGRLTAVKPAPDRVLKNGRHLTMWECVCTCGKTAIIRSCDLKSGLVQSCGCYRAENTGRISTTHGATKNHRATRLYSVWAAMKTRCDCESDRAYRYYGKRGIKVCDEWHDDFAAFKAWAYANGYADGLSIDRRENDSCGG